MSNTAIIDIHDVPELSGSGAYEPDGSPSESRSRFEIDTADPMSNEIPELTTTANRNKFDQDFYQLREESLAKKIDADNTKYLFEDPTFPAHISSIFPNGIPDDQKKYFTDIVWKRPGELAAYPKFFVEGLSRFDVQQNHLGDCWAVASLCSLAMHPRLLYQVVPQDQGFEEVNYAGIFHFRFWQFGKWVDVVIDDRLPADSESNLMFARSPECNEFWVPLVEKAYAKFYGSWKAIQHGSPLEALEDFTGGLAFHYPIFDSERVSFYTIQYAQKRTALMVCDSKPEETEAMKRLVIIPNHSYSITQAVNYGGQELLKMRNPWGKSEWTGQFSDKDVVWERNKDMSEALNFTDRIDGEFFIPHGKVHRYFNRLRICYSPVLGDYGKKLKEKAFEGRWVRPEPTAKDTDYSEAEILSRNMQFRIILEIPDTEDGKCTVTVALMQKNRRRKFAEQLPIGVKIYHLEDPKELPTPLTTDFFEKHKPLSSASRFGDNWREVYNVIKLEPGAYCMIPCVYSLVDEQYVLTCNEEEEFLLRLFLGNIPNIKEAIMTMNKS